MELAKRQNTIRDLLIGDKFKQQVALALPKHLSPDTFIRVALTALTRTPKLMECDQASFFTCLLDLSARGLWPDGQHAHLIPYGTKCTLIIDYKGIAKLIMQSGEVRAIRADVVYERDDFSFSYGTDEHLKHRPNLSGNRGKMICAYSYVSFKEGDPSFIVMSIDEIERIRQRSRAANNGPWVTDFGEMAKKTVFRRHAKWLPFSSDLLDKVQRDDDVIDLDADISVPAELPRPVFQGQQEQPEQSVQPEPVKRRGRPKKVQAEPLQEAVQPTDAGTGRDEDDLDMGEVTP